MVQSMDTATRRRIAQVERETLLRLANKAEEEGVRVLLTAAGEHFAALLQAELGLIPDVAPEPEPIAAAVAVKPVTVSHLLPMGDTVRCESCGGKGFYFTRVEGVSQPYSMTCSPCHGTGQVKVELIVGERPLWVVA